MACVTQADVDPTKCLVYTTLEGNILSVSRGFSMTYGWLSAEVSGKPVQTLSDGNIQLERALTAIRDAMEEARASMSGNAKAALRKSVADPMMGSRGSLMPALHTVASGMDTDLTSRKSRPALMREALTGFQSENARDRRKLSSVLPPLTSVEEDGDKPESLERADQLASPRGRRAMRGHTVGGHRSLLVKKGSLQHITGLRVREHAPRQSAREELIRHVEAEMQHKYLKKTVKIRANFSIVGESRHTVLEILVEMDEDPTGVLACTREGKLVHISASVEEALGYPGGTLVAASATVGHLLPFGQGRFHRARLSSALLAGGRDAPHIPCKVCERHMAVPGGGNSSMGPCQDRAVSSCMQNRSDVQAPVRAHEIACSRLGAAFPSISGLRKSSRLPMTSTHPLSRPQMGQIVLLRGNQGAAVPAVLSWSPQRVGTGGKPVYVCKFERAPHDPTLSVWGFRSIVDQTNTQRLLRVIVSSNGAVVAAGHGFGYSGSKVPGGVFGINARTMVGTNCADHVDILGAVVKVAKKFSEGISVEDVMGRVLSQIGEVCANGVCTAFRGAMLCPPAKGRREPDRVPVRLSVVPLRSSRVNVSALSQGGAIPADMLEGLRADGYVVDIWSANWVTSELSISHNGIVKAADLLFEVLSGMSASRVLGKHVSSLLEDGPEGGKDGIRGLLMGKKMSVEARLKHVDGSLVPVLALGQGETPGERKRRMTLVLRGVIERAEPETEALHRMQVRSEVDRCVWQEEATAVSERMECVLCR